MTNPKWTSIADLLMPAASGSSMFGIVGAPVGLAAVTPGRCDLAPPSIRHALSKISAFDVSNGVDLESTSIIDWGDMAVSAMTPEEANETIQTTVHDVAHHTTGSVVILGGNNSITRSAFQGVRRRIPNLGLVTLDAHHDVRETEAGLNNGNPIRALIEDGVNPANIVQIGIQPFSNSKAHTEYVRAQGLHFITLAEVRRDGLERVTDRAITTLSARCDALYVDLDLDVMDRAFVPSTAGSRPGGLSVTEVLGALRVLGSSRKVAALDIVEHNPDHDVNETTAFTAAVCLAAYLSSSLSSSGWYRVGDI